MGDLIERQPTLPELPSFGWLEKLAAELAEARVAAAEEVLSAQALLARVDDLIAKTFPLGSLDTQAVPAGRGIIATYLGLLLKAYPNSGGQDATIFGRLMRDDVHSLEASEAAIEIACRRWRQKSKFLPAISELMAEVRAAKSEIDGAREFAENLPALRARLAAAIERG